MAGIRHYKVVTGADDPSKEVNKNEWNDDHVIDDGTLALPKLAAMATASFIGRYTAGSGTPEVLSAATVKVMLGINNVDNTSDANKPVSTAQAVADTAALNTAKAYADGLVVGLLDDRGSYNASVNTFPASGGSGAAGAIVKGDLWFISVAGTLGGVAVNVGDSARALVDTPGQTAGNWSVLESNLGYVPMNIATYDADGDGVVDTAETLVLLCRNNTGVTISKMAAVYITGATGQNPTIALAKADSEITSGKTIGVVTADIANNATGLVAMRGTLHDFDTSAFADGTTLWLSAVTAGVFTTTRPVAPNHAVLIGFTAYSHANNGKIALYVANGQELDELHDVLITALANNEVLQYDSTSGTWKNRSTLAGISIGGNAATVTVADAAADTTCWPMLATSQTGNQAPTTDGGLIYNASTNALTTGEFVANGIAGGLEIANANSQDAYQASIGGSMTLNTAQLNALSVSVSIIGGASSTTLRGVLLNNTFAPTANADFQNLYNQLTLNSGASPATVYGEASVFALGAAALGGTIANYYGKSVVFSANAAATTNLNNWNAYFANNPVNGALQSIANVRGFYGAIVAGTGRWNCYMAGTAINYMAGALLLGSTTNDGVNQLQVTGSATISGGLSVVGGVFDLPNYTTGTRPTAATGNMIYDTTLNKACIGTGAGTWQVITSA